MLGLASRHWTLPSCQLRYQVQPRKFTAVYFFVSDSFFCLSPPLALSNNWAIVHASHISTITGSTQSTNHRGRCAMGAHPSRHGLRSLSLWIAVSRASRQPMNQQLQNIQYYLLPTLKLISCFEGWHLRQVRHFFHAKHFIFGDKGKILTYLRSHLSASRQKHGAAEVAWKYADLFWVQWKQRVVWD